MQCKNYLDEAHSMVERIRKESKRSKKRDKRKAISLPPGAAIQLLAPTNINFIEGKTCYGIRNTIIGFDSLKSQEPGKEMSMPLGSNNPRSAE
jgi:hypothetical protein